MKRRASLISPPVMWRRLLEDPNFRNAVKCRYLALRQTILSEESIDAFLDSYATLLDEAKDRQLQKYKEILKSDNPWDFGPTSFFAAYRVSSYEEEIAIVKDWFRQRLAFLDANLPGECTSATDGIQPLTWLGLDLRMEGTSAVIHCEKPLVRIDVVNAVGACIESYPINRLQDATVDLGVGGHGLRIIVCYAADGSMVARSVLF